MSYDILITLAIIAILGIIVFAVSKNFKRTIQVMSGWGAYQLLSLFYDYILWGYIQYQYGIYGSIGLSIGALVINYFLLLWYMRKGIDWLGMDIVEKIKNNGSSWTNKFLDRQNNILFIITYIPVKLFDLMIYVLNKNDIFAFFVLSIWQDPFVATIYLRHGRKGPVTKEDYIVLLSSTVVTSLYWIVFIEIVLDIIGFLFK